jgi:5'(3')-deoxyribonucleotidase
VVTTGDDFVTTRTLLSPFFCHFDLPPKRDGGAASITADPLDILRYFSPLPGPNPGHGVKYALHKAARPISRGIPSIMARIAVDMDDVIADTLAKVLDEFNRRHGLHLSKSDLIGAHFHEILAVDQHRNLMSMVLEDTFFGDLPVMPHAAAVLERLSKHHEIFIATAAMEVPTSFNAKYQWLLTHFPFIAPLKIVFCGDKSIINADYLIDDNPRHFARFIGTGILFDSPQNAHAKGYHRVHSWLEVEEYFKNIQAQKESTVSAN